jgi:hypothetical protein
MMWWCAKEVMMMELRYCEECACYVTDTCRSGHAKTFEVKIEPGKGFVIVRPKEAPPPKHDG